MDDLIEEIMKIEEHAQEVMSDAREAEREIDNRLARDGERMQRDILARTKEKDIRLINDENDEAQKEIDKIYADTEKSLNALEEKYRENKDSWTDGIVKNIIGG